MSTIPIPLPFASSSTSSHTPSPFPPPPLPHASHPFDPSIQSFGDDIDVSDLIPDPEDDGGEDENIFRDMTFDEILEDLNARFLVNLPKEESSLVRVYWQAEQA